MSGASVLRALLLWLALVLPAAAVQPDEMLADPVLEHRAREIGEVLRCPVCQGETIDESNAPISRDLRLYVRERLSAGDTDEQVIDAVTRRFGEFVLFKPRASGSTLLLYWAGPVMLLLGLAGAALFMRARRRAPAATVPLSAAEQAQLDRLLNDQDS